MNFPFHIVFILLMRRNPFPVRVIIMKEFCLTCKDAYDSIPFDDCLKSLVTIKKFYIAPYTTLHMHTISMFKKWKLVTFSFIQRQQVSNYDVPGRWLKEGRNISLTKTRVNNLLVNIDADYEFVKVCRWYKNVTAISRWRKWSSKDKFLYS
jgi:hypothetical protein